MNDIFLSASVPGPEDHPYCETADPMLIHSAVRSLCSLVFGSKRIVWGGHPAITPMMWAACENLGVAYAASVCLYQSRYFEELYPEENRQFKNVVYVDAADTIEASLAAMRSSMITGHDFESGIFIGGKKGVEVEFALFRSAHPGAQPIIFPSTGGAARTLGERFPELSAPGGDFVDFVGYMASRLHFEKQDLSHKG